MFAATGFIDVVQWVLDFFVVGLAINEIADPIIGALFAIYLQLRGVSPITKPKRLASLIGSYFGEALTDSIAPAWILDTWYIHSDVMKEEAQLQSAKEQTEFMQPSIRSPLNQGGVRAPVSEINNGHIAPAPSQVRYFNGVGRPTPSRIMSTNPREAAETKEVFRHMGYTEEEAEEAIKTPAEQADDAMRTH